MSTYYNFNLFFTFSHMNVTTWLKVEYIQICGTYHLVTDYFTRHEVV